MSGCYGTNSVINNIRHETGGSKFKARIVEKEKRQTWWEHSFKVVLDFCGPEDASERLARSFGSALDGCAYKSYEVDSCVVRQAGKTITADVKVISSSADAADAERAADQVLTSFMRRNKNLIDTSFELSSQQKEKVTKFDAWEGVDSYG